MELKPTITPPATIRRYFRNCSVKGYLQSVPPVPVTSLFNQSLSFSDVPLSEVVVQIEETHPNQMEHYVQFLTDRDRLLVSLSNTEQ